MCQIKVSATAYMGDSFGATFVRVILWLDLVLGAGRGRSDSPTEAQDRRAGRPNGLGPGLTSLMDTDTAAGRSDYPEQQ